MHLHLTILQLWLELRYRACVTDICGECPHSRLPRVAPRPIHESMPAVVQCSDSKICARGRQTPRESAYVVLGQCLPTCPRLSHAVTVKEAAESRELSYVLAS